MIKEVQKIFWQSLPTLLIASFLSSLGGIGLSLVQKKVLLITPLLILLPALNDMAGDYGTILSSKFTTWLYRGTIPFFWYRSKRLKNLVRNILLLALFYSFFLSSLVLLLSFFKGFPFNFSLALKIFLVSLITTTVLILLLSLLVFIFGSFLYQKKVDPDNILIPLATSLADFGTLLTFALLVHFLFRPF